MVAHLLKIIDPQAIRETVRIDALKSVLFKEKRTALVIITQGQPHPVIGFPISESTTARPGGIIYRFGNGMIGRRGSHDVRDQAFVPSPDGEVHVETVVRTPVPEETVAAIGMPVPVGRTPDLIYPFSEVFLPKVVALEIFFGTEQAHAQVGCFHDIGPVVDAVEWDRLAGTAVDEMRIDAMKAIGTEQEIRYLRDPADGSIPTDPSSFHGYDGSHDSEARTTRCAGIGAEGGLAEIGLVPGLIDVIPIIDGLDGIGTFQCHTTPWMGMVPEEAEGLALYLLHQLIIGKPLLYFCRGDIGSVRDRAIAS